MRTIGTGGTIRRFGQGVSYGSGASAIQLADWRLATPEDRAAVETAGYFNVLAEISKVGETIMASLDLDGTPILQFYMISANDGTNVSVTRADDDSSGGGGRAVIPTAAGLTTGQILPTDSFVIATSASAAHILMLPECSAATIGREIQIWVVPSTNCELQTATASGDTINNVDCSGGAVEALLTHTQLYICRQHLATGWLLQAFTALGAVATAIVPD